MSDKILNNINTTLTAVAAIVGTLAAMFASGAKDEAQNAKGQASEAKIAVEEFDEYRKKVDENYKFAEVFLNNLNNLNNFENPTLSRSQKLRGTLGALDVVAKASSNEDGDSSVEQRIMLPIYMALTMGDAGSLAMLDEQLIYLYRWKQIAALSDDDSVRNTAILALSKICRWASIHGDIQKVEKGGSAILELLEVSFDTTDVNDMLFRAETLLEASTFSQHLQKQNINIIFPKVLEDTMDAIRSKKNAVIKNLEQLENGNNPRDFNALDKELTSDQEVRLRKILRLSRSEEVIAAEDQDRRTTQKAANKNQGEITGITIVEIKDLLELLTSPDTTIRRGTRAKLALYGKDAIPPLFEGLRKYSMNPNSKGAYRTQLGIAIALSNIRQPVTLDEDQVDLAVDLLKSKHSEIRLAALDFLIKLEELNTVKLAFTELTALVNNTQNSDPKGGGPAVVNAVTAVGYWLTTIPGDSSEAVGLKKELKSTLVGWKSGKLSGPEWKQARDRISRYLAKYKEPKNN